MIEFINHPKLFFMKYNIHNYAMSGNESIHISCRYQFSMTFLIQHTFRDHKKSQHV